MDLTEVTYQGPPVDDVELFPLLPPKLRTLLEQVNGFIQFGGGLHVRGACRDPEWHSLRRAWMGKEAFHRFYRTITETDVPFGQDFLGNQFLLRGDHVIKLMGETGEIEELGLPLLDFIEAAQADSTTVLNLEALLLFQEQGGSLDPGELLQAEPPFCTQEADGGVGLTPVPVDEQLAYLRQFHGRIKSVSEDGKINFKS